MKPNFSFSSLTKVFVGALAIVVAIVIFAVGQSKGIFIDATGREAYLRAAMMVVFGCALLLAPFYQTGKGDWSYLELFLYIALMLLVEIVPHYIVRCF